MQSIIIDLSHRHIQLEYFKENGDLAQFPGFDHPVPLAFYPGPTNIELGISAMRAKESGNPQAYYDYFTLIPSRGKTFCYQGNDYEMEKLLLFTLEEQIAAHLRREAAETTLAGTKEELPLLFLLENDITDNERRFIEESMRSGGYENVYTVYMQDIIGNYFRRNMPQKFYFTVWSDGKDLHLALDHYQTRTSVKKSLPDFGIDPRIRKITDLIWEDIEPQTYELPREQQESLLIKAAKEFLASDAPEIDGNIQLTDGRMYSYFLSRTSIMNLRMPQSSSIQNMIEHFLEVNYADRPKILLFVRGEIAGNDYFQRLIGSGFGRIIEENKDILELIKNSLLESITTTIVEDKETKEPIAPIREEKPKTGNRRRPSSPTVTTPTPPPSPKPINPTFNPGTPSPNPINPSPNPINPINPSPNPTTSAPNAPGPGTMPPPPPPITTPTTPGGTFGPSGITAVAPQGVGQPQKPRTLELRQMIAATNGTIRVGDLAKATQMRDQINKIVAAEGEPLELQGKLREMEMKYANLKAQMQTGGATMAQTPPPPVPKGVGKVPPLPPAGVGMTPPPVPAGGGMTPPPVPGGVKGPTIPPPVPPGGSRPIAPTSTVKPIGKAGAKGQKRATAKKKSKGEELLARGDIAEAKKEFIASGDDKNAALCTAIEKAERHCRPYETMLSNCILTKNMRQINQALTELENLKQLKESAGMPTTELKELINNYKSIK